MAQSVDLVGNALIVSDIQIASATAAAGVGATGNSISTFMAGATSAITTTGKLSVLFGSTATVHGAASAGIQAFSATGPGLYWGLSTPTFSAATGSLYINTDSGSVAATTALYINTTGVSTWVAVL